MISNLSLLYADTLYPYISGALVQSLSLAKFTQDCFESVTIFAMDEKNQYNGLIDDVNVVQEIKFNNYFDKLSYFAAGLFSRSFSFESPKKCIIQQKYHPIPIQKLLISIIYLKKNLLINSF